MEVKGEYEAISLTLAKGAMRAVPVEAHLENEVGGRYVLNGTLLFVSEGDKVMVHSQNASVRPDR